MFNKKEKTQNQFVRLYSIYDMLSQQYGPVFQAQNDAVAIRNYINLMKDIRFRKDFRLDCVGMFYQNGHVQPDLYTVDNYLIDETLEKSFDEEYETRKKELQDLLKRAQLEVANCEESRLEFQKNNIKE